MVQTSTKYDSISQLLVLMKSAHKSFCPPQGLCIKFPFIQKNSFSECIRKYYLCLIFIWTLSPWQASSQISSQETVEPSNFSSIFSPTRKTSQCFLLDVTQCKSRVTFQIKVSQGSYRIGCFSIKKKKKIVVENLLLCKCCLHWNCPRNDDFVSRF